MSIKEFKNVIWIWFVFGAINVCFEDIRNKDISFKLAGIDDILMIMLLYTVDQ